MAKRERETPLIQAVSFLFPLHREGDTHPENYSIAQAEYRFSRNQELKEFQIGTAIHVPHQDAVRITVRFYCYLKVNQEEFKAMLKKAFNRIYPLHRFEFREEAI